MDKLTKKIEEGKLGIINEILDKALDKIHNEEFIVQKENQRQELVQRTYYQKIKIFARLRPCIYPGCTNKSIKRSHSIQKNAVLRYVSDDNHLYKPGQDMSTEEPNIIMKKIGVNNASTFPGFCKDHERLFEKFEKKGAIELKEEALLQTYRAICREIVYREYQMEISKHQKEVYDKELQKLAKQYIFNEMKAHGIDIELNKISFSNINDEFINYHENNINYLSRIINELNGYMISSLNGNDDEIVSHELTIDYSFPICIAGFGNQKYNYYDEERNFILVLNVIPYENKTVINWYSLKIHESIFQSVIKYYTQNTLTILNFIESFMVNSSDHWFISPIYWDSLPKIKREYILQCLLHTNESFLQEIPYSIFDDIRIIFIDAFIKGRKGIPLTPVEEEFLKNEKAKLTKKIILKPKHEIIKGLMENIFG